MSVRAPVGPVNFATQRICIGRGLAAIRASGLLDRDFLFYALLSKQPEIQGNEGAVFASINKKAIESIEIPLPEVVEQKRIVAILDEAFSGIEKAIANTEKNLSNSKELFRSRLNTIFSDPAFSWTSLKLEKLCEIKHGFAFKSKYFANEGEHVVLTPGSFWEEGGFRDQGKKTKYYHGEIPEGFILNKGDFLIAMTEQAAGLLGSSLIVPTTGRYLHNQRLGRVMVKEHVHWENDFFFHQFNTDQFRAAVQSTASGLKVRHTSPKKLGQIVVKVPANRADQNSISEHLNNLKKQVEILELQFQAKLHRLNELRQSLLRKAFSGDLTSDSARREAETAIA